MPLLQFFTQTHNYSYVGDNIAIALCLAMLVLVHMSNLKRTVRLKITYIILTEILISAITGLTYQQMLTAAPITAPHWQIFVLRVMHYVMLCFVLLMYTLYLYEPLWIPHRKQRKNMVFSIGFAAAMVLLDIAASLFRFGFYFDANGDPVYGFNAYVIVFAVLLAQIFTLIILNRSRIIRQVLWGLIGINAVTVLLLLLQGNNRTASYTTVALSFPIIGLIYMFHSNPYDVDTGAVSEAYFYNELEECISRDRSLRIISCRIRGVSDLIRHSKEFRSEYYTFLRGNVGNGVLYQFADGKMVLTLKQHGNEDTQEAVDKMLNDFKQSYDRLKLDYQIIVLSTTKEITSVQDYPRLVEYVEQKMSINDIATVTEKDIKDFYNSRYILTQLEDIATKNDLSDPRVLVYCQPVFNLQTGHYDTAEALMRLTLEKTGMVYPDQFIPLAEQNNLIHTLSLIILDKTCAAIRDFMEEGYEIQRASVNFSVTDLRYSEFCKEVEKIIDRNGIPYDKIAIEITESRSDADFRVMKEKVLELQKLGIKFYLDDFGTGYSNFERIMEIPFDIIKFDRSMLIELGKSDASRFMVNTFAEMFNQLHYSVLFEGVENENDEQSCINMNAKYLQGYKYSRPIPIALLRDFLCHPDTTDPSPPEVA